MFVHGFNGKAVGSWKQFHAAGQESDWWRLSDMLFVGYKSKTDTIVGVANRLEAGLAQLFPDLPDEHLVGRDCRVRDPAEQLYKKLILVGHSLGGVIVRRMLMDLAWRWQKQRDQDPRVPASPLLVAQQRLFSPANAGIRMAGWLALLKAPEKWRIAEVLLSTAPAYQELEPGSLLLQRTRDLTQELHQRHATDLGALAASIAWAEPDKVVQPDYYLSDAYQGSIDGTNHRSVCKPSDSYQTPYTFVETGTVR